jgi:diphthamide biosynthesis methyltransferase
MKYTKHIKEKMSQRGINRELLEIVLIYGIVKQDKVILNKKRCLKILRKIDNYNKKVKRVGNSLHIKNLNSSRSIILKILDKGGVTLVIVGDTLITTYNTNIRLKKRRRYKRKR